MTAHELLQRPQSISSGEQLRVPGNYFAKRSFAWAAAAGAALVLANWSAAAQEPGNEARNKVGGETTEQTCGLEAGPQRSVVRVIDAETVLLDDGSEVRLIGALAPRSPDLKPDAQAWPPEQRAEDALRALVVGRGVELAFAGRRLDRYGRQLAHLFLERGGERVWVQGEMLSSGNARAYGIAGSFTCMRELLAHEWSAREARTGIWAEGAYEPRQAWQTRALMRLRNSYQIVTGRVVAVEAKKTRTYLNFGKNWRTDFTAGVDAKVLRAHPQLAQQLKALEGRRVEVRGWIEYRGGPYIDVEDPAQIEAVEERPPRRLPAPEGPATSSGRRQVPGENGDAPGAKERRPGKAPGVDL